MLKVEVKFIFSVGRGLCQRGGWVRKSLNVLTVEVKVIFERVLVIFIVK